MSRKERGNTGDSIEVNRDFGDKIIKCYLWKLCPDLTTQFRKELFETIRKIYRLSIRLYLGFIIDFIG